MSMLSQLKPPSGAVHSKKRVGRGTSSGHGKTSTRGGKGQTARTSPDMPSAFEGGQMPIHKRLPKRGFKAPFGVDYEIVNVTTLSERFEPNSVVTKEGLVRTGLVRKEKWPLKILGDGEMTKPLTVVADRFSKSAKEKIEAVGGKALLVAEAKAQGIIK